MEMTQSGHGLQWGCEPFPCRTPRFSTTARSGEADAQGALADGGRRGGGWSLTSGSPAARSSVWHGFPAAGLPDPLPPRPGCLSQPSCAHSTHPTRSEPQKCFPSRIVLQVFLHLPSFPERNLSPTQVPIAGSVPGV